MALTPMHSTVLDVIEIASGYANHHAPPEQRVCAAISILVGATVWIARSTDTRFILKHLLETALETIEKELHKDDHTEE
jgi:uncharacterized protein YsxB (DUF464 family)